MYLRSWVGKSNRNESSTLRCIGFRIRAVLKNKPLCASNTGGGARDLLDCRRCNSIHLSKVTFIQGENCHISCSWGCFRGMLSFVQSQLSTPQYQILLCHLRQLSTTWWMRIDRRASNRKTENHITEAYSCVLPSYLISVTSEGARIAYFFTIRS